MWQNKNSGNKTDRETRLHNGYNETTNLLTHFLRVFVVFSSIPSLFGRLHARLANYGVRFCEINFSWQKKSTTNGLMENRTERINDIKCPHTINFRVEFCYCTKYFKHNLTRLHRMYTYHRTGFVFVFMHPFPSLLMYVCYVMLCYTRSRILNLSISIEDSPAQRRYLLCEQHIL